jgi:predicted ATP-dependent serine protease
MDRYPGIKVYETPADYYDRLTREDWMARARAAGRLRFQCPTCATVSMDAGKCPKCQTWVGDQFAYAVHHETNPKRRTPRDEDGCDELRCLTSVSRKCKCRCQGRLHGTEERTA